MGRIINTIPPQPDATRPKLMNMKFELVPEAEGAFEPLLHVRLDDGENINFEFVCKHTPYCDRCRWWNHTATDGCPRLRQQPGDQAEDQGMADNFSARNDQGRRQAWLDLNASVTGGIREAVRDLEVISHQTVAESSLRAASGHQAQPRPGLSGNTGRPGSLHQQIGGTSSQAWAPPPGQPGTGHARIFQPSHNSHLQEAHCGLGERFMGGNQQWQPSVLEVAKIMADELLRRRLSLQDREAGQHREEASSRELAIVPEQEVANGRTGTERRDQQGRRLRGDGIRRADDRIGRRDWRAKGGEHGTEGGIGEEKEIEVEDVESPRDIQDGALVRSREDQAMEDNLILPFVCTLQGQEIFVLCIRTEEGGHVMPASNILEISSPQFINMKVRQLFAERFCFRLFPEDPITRFQVDLPGGDKARYAVPLVDARIPPDLWMNIGSVNLIGIPLRLFLSDPNGELEAIAVEPGMTTTLLQRLNGELPKRRNLTSAYFAEDVYRTVNPLQPGFTWSGRPPQAAGATRRLDFFLVAESLASNVIQINEQNADLSDHKPVLMSVHSDSQGERGPECFRLNTQMLEDEGVCGWVEQFWKDWEEAKQSFETRGEWLEVGLRIISNKMETFSSIAAYLRNMEEQDCKRRVDEAEQRINSHPISEVAWTEERAARLQEWDKIQQAKQIRWEQILAEKKIVTGDCMTKETFQRLLPKRRTVQMKELCHPHLNGMPLANSNEALCNYAAAYFSDILTSRSRFEDPCTNLAEHSDVWDSLGSALSGEAQNELDRPLTAEELTHTLHTMAKGKAPGEDGLPLEFYKACWSMLVEDLVAVYNEIPEGGKLGKSIAKGIITLLYKKGDRSEIRNWRPISLLNLSYKVLAKMLANRLAIHLPGLVGLDQGAFVRGRSIMDNLATAIELLEVIDGKNEEVAVLRLDLEKAYDRVNWAFVLTTLKAMNFGEAFCSWVRVLYLFSSAVVQVNGYHSEEFNLSRSLRQGCLLAPLLFVLQLDVLLHDIRVHPLLEGLRLKSGKECRVKALADDLLALSANTVDPLEALKQCPLRYADLSEAAVNWNKSIYYLLKDYQLKVEWGMHRVQEGEAERYLGVQLALGDSSESQSLISKEKVTGRIKSWGSAHAKGEKGAGLARPRNTESGPTVETDCEGGSGRPGS
ncbi:hypothetical protein CBR_g20085 [Chara braunii]|uniref:Reverse transcriptase domain-containing protein n=1 Tax=Chara braunii TaxID=69332 RepID=A0A388KZG3_CHABU|nr:hypothetical protein CBR_g20085 [Chara braunii]|eukprot:GBG75454.1 hypothetical protein CBR_g20085 [Chara braunii]